MPNDLGKNIWWRMGGYGSGKRYDAKGTEEDYLSIDVRYLHRHGFTRPQRRGMIAWRRGKYITGQMDLYSTGDEIRFHYVHTGADRNKSSLDYPIKLSWSFCNLGGKRAWFICPRCARRVAVLYCSKIFVCRHCLDINYQSTREREFDRAARQAVKIRERMGWDGGVLCAIGNKPKGMHWKTYTRLMIRYKEYSQKSFAGMLKYIGVSDEAWIDDH